MDGNLSIADNVPACESESNFLKMDEKLTIDSGVATPEPDSNLVHDIVEDVLQSALDKMAIQSNQDTKKDIFNNWAKPKSSTKEIIIPKDDAQSECSSPVIQEAPVLTKHHSMFITEERGKRISRLFGRDLFTQSPAALVPRQRTIHDGPVLKPSQITKPVRATNPVLDEILHSLKLVELNDPSLTVLDLKDSFRVFKPELGTFLATHLMHNTHLVSLNLTNCNLQTVNACEIAEALRYNHSLQHVILDNNQIQPVGIRAFADMLQVNQTLKELSLNHQRTKTGTDAEQQLAKGVSKNETLIKLGLQIRDVSSRHMIDSQISRNKERLRKSRFNKS